MLNIIKNTDIKVIENEDIKKEELEQIYKLEQDVNLINETMRILNDIYSENKEKKENILEDITTVNDTVSVVNEELKETIKIKKNYIKNTIALAGTGLLLVNAPIGILYGLTPFIASSIITVTGLISMYSLSS